MCEVINTNKQFKDYEELTQKERIYNKLNNSAQNYIKAVYSYFEIDIEKIIELNKSDEPFINIKFTGSGFKYLNNITQPNKEQDLLINKIEFDSPVISIVETAIKIAHYIFILRNELIKSDKCYDDILLNYLAYPFQHFVYFNNDIYLFKYPVQINETTDKFENLFLGVHSPKGIFIELKDSLLDLLRNEYNKLKSEEKELAKSEAMSSEPCDAVLNKAIIKDITKVPDYSTSQKSFSPMEFQKRWNASLEEPETKPVYKITDYAKEERKILTIQFRKTTSAFDSTFIFYHIYNNYPHQTDLYIPNDKKDFLDMLAFTTYRQKIFSASYGLGIQVFNNVYNIKNFCILYNNNVILYLGNNYFVTLRDYLINIIQHLINNNIITNKVNSVIGYAKTIYDCIFNEIRCNSDLYPAPYKITNNSILLKYIYQNKLYTITNDNRSGTSVHTYPMPGEVYLKTEPVMTSEPSADLLYILKTLTNDNYFILANMIRIITNYCLQGKSDKNAYIFFNCPEKIFSLYKEFFSHIKLNGIFTIDNTSELSRAATIPELLTCQLNGVGPIFVDEVMETKASQQIKRLRRLFNGTIINDEPKNNKPDNNKEKNYNLKDYFKYCKYEFRNNIPILINCKDQDSINFIEKYFKDKYYKNDFKSVDITEDEFNICLDKIKSLSPTDLSYIFINMVSYGLYHINNRPENTDNSADKDTVSAIPKEQSSYSDFDITEEFFKKCCKTNEGSEIKTKDLFTAYKLFNKDVHSRTVEDTKYNKFAKDMSEIIEKTNEKKSKSKSANKTIITRKKIGSQNAYKSLTLKRTYLKMVDEILKNNAVTASAEADTKQSTDTAGNVTETDIRSTAADTNDKLTGIDILIKQINDTPPELKIITL